MNPHYRLGALAGLTVVIAIALINSVFVVDQRQQAIVLRLGAPEYTVNAGGQNDAGLWLKLPFAETVVAFDRQNQAVEVSGQEMAAADHQRLSLSAYVRYRIVDPQRYYASFGDDQTGRDHIERLAITALRDSVGKVSGADLIAGQRGAVMSAALVEVAAQAKAAKMGIQVIDLAITRTDLPSANAAAVIDRMKTQILQDAAAVKTEGDADALKIKAAGDKDVADIQSQAQADASKIRGDGDAKRADLYAGSFGRDAEFASFYRSMQAYDKALAANNTTLVLSQDSEFLKYFRMGAGK
jgi:membrane protease subunit HflC